MFVSDVQPVKTELPISVRPEPKSTDARLVQPWNAHEATYHTLSGILTLVSDVQL